MLFRSMFAFVSTKHTDASKGPFVFLAFASFLLGDGVRYPFYIVKTIGAEKSFLGNLFGHLRYNVWIICYPLGAFCDTMAGVFAAETIERLGIYQSSLPNKYNWAFSYPFVCKYCVPGFLLFAFWVNFFHLWN